jgi:hypothetical protein
MFLSTGGGGLLDSSIIWHDNIFVDSYTHFVMLQCNSMYIFYYLLLDATEQQYNIWSYISSSL